MTSKMASRFSLKTLWGRDDTPVKRDPHVELSTDDRENLLEKTRDDLERFKQEVLNKARGPMWFWRAPYGIPREVDIWALRQLAQHHVVWSIVTKHIIDPIFNLEWDIRPADDTPENREELEEEIKRVKEWLKCVNENGEDFMTVLKMVTKDIAQLDAGVIVKEFSINSYEVADVEEVVYTPDGHPEKRTVTRATLKEMDDRDLIQFWARDGGQFLKNMDNHGRYQEPAYFMYSYNTGFTALTNEPRFQRMTYDEALSRWDEYKRNMNVNYPYSPIPFSKGEIVYMMKNPSTYSYYGESSIQILADVILMLKYCVMNDYDFFESGSIPPMIAAIDVDKKTFKGLRKQWKEMLTERRPGQTLLGRARRKFNHVLMIRGKKEQVETKALSVTSAEMELLAKQKWFVELVLMCFGLNLTEIGIITGVYKAATGGQQALAKRKAQQPFIQLIEAKVNNELLPELTEADLVFEFDTADISDEMAREQLEVLRMKNLVTSPKERRLELGKGDPDPEDPWFKWDKGPEEEKDEGKVSGEFSEGFGEFGEFNPEKEQEKFYAGDALTTEEVVDIIHKEVAKRRK